MTDVVAGIRSSSTTSTRTDQPPSGVLRTPVTPSGSRPVSSRNSATAARMAPAPVRFPGSLSDEVGTPNDDSSIVRSDRNALEPCYSLALGAVLRTVSCQRRNSTIDRQSGGDRGDDWSNATPTKEPKKS